MKTPLLIIMMMPAQFPQGGGVYAGHAESPIVWIGNVGDGKWDTAANWTPATVPVDGRIARFISGAVDLTVGPAVVPKLWQLQIESGYTGDIAGAVSNIQVDAEVIRINKLKGDVKLMTSAHDVYIESTAPSGASGGSSVVLQQKSGANDVITNLIVTRTEGAVGIEALHTVTNVFMTPMAGRFVKLEIAASVVISKLVALSGAYLFDAKSGATEVFTVGSRGRGVCKLEFIDAAAHGTLIIGDGGTVRHRSTGAITTLEIYGGELNANRSEHAGFTIANALLAGGLLDLTGIANITLTNDLDYLDGDFRPPLGSILNTA